MPSNRCECGTVHCTVHLPASPSDEIDMHIKALLRDLKKAKALVARNVGTKREARARAVEAEIAERLTVALRQ